MGGSGGSGGGGSGVRRHRVLMGNEGWWVDLIWMKWMNEWMIEWMCTIYYTHVRYWGWNVTAV